MSNDSYEIVGYLSEEAQEYSRQQGHVPVDRDRIGPYADRLDARRIYNSWTEKSFIPTGADEPVSWYCCVVLSRNYSVVSQVGMLPKGRTDAVDISKLMDQDLNTLTSTLKKEPSRPYSSYLHENSFKNVESPTRRSPATEPLPGYGTVLSTECRAQVQQFYDDTFASHPDHRPTEQ